MGLDSNLGGFCYSYLNYLWVVARLNLDSVDKHLVGSQRFVSEVPAANFLGRYLHKI